ncbi:sugar transferase [Phytomonospora endophytica]|uniref:Exopolysaccharide biosynthesis polyprenyl glycosylphosphotransferase n=1 Tax=Phytomonospora endophytica TaxID=714109 RepID=A0A841FCT7_9ACTN|nr:sugar transferase [Phytomonospora endophytica]MBB6035101.1 exopolysaccharide biosynthesis polyprenyl glycosylphosphotransferase [Phytomonospora endophytica]
MRVEEPTTSGVPRSPWQRTVRAATWHRTYVAALFGIDVLAVIAASMTAVITTGTATTGFDGYPKFGQYGPEMKVETVFYVIAYGALPLTWILTLWGNGCYDRRYLGVGTDEFKRVVRASLVVVSIVSFTALLFKTDLSRYAVAVALSSALLYLVIGRFVARRVLVALRRHKQAVHHLLLVGTLHEALEVNTAVSRVPQAGFLPIGVYLTEGAAAARGIETPVPVYSGTDLVSLAETLGADTIAVCGSASAERGGLRRLAWQLEGTGIDLVVAPQLTDIAGPRVHIRPVEGVPLLHVEEPTLSGMGWFIKNMLDKVSAFAGLMVLLPVFIAIAIAIKSKDSGPVFFRQPRVGMEGKTFRCWKFRTMYVDAEERLATLMDQNESDGLLFKMKDDPRITPVGRFLRRTSLDELPQLINVLRGEMSLVGPRPLVAENGDFLGDVRRRLLVRPGITGLWQVSGRSDLSWDDAVRLDLYYVDNWSLTTDLQILFRTVLVVLQRKGAY